MNNKILIIIILSGLGLIVNNCRPNFISPVNKRLIGSWTASPKGDTLEVWTFTSDHKLYITKGSDTLYYPDPANGQAIPYIVYDINKGLGKVRLYVDGYFYDPSKEGNDRSYFQIFKLKKDELYLYSVDGKIDGSTQKGFTR